MILSLPGNASFWLNCACVSEKSPLLTRTVTELGQEVSDTLEERVVLEYQLEQLKSIGNDDN